LDFLIQVIWLADEGFITHLNHWGKSMKLIVASIVAMMSLFTVGAQAEELNAVLFNSVMPAEVAPPATTQPEPARPNCRELGDRLKTIQSKMRNLQSAVVADYYNTQSVMNSWYYQLSANYGRTVYVPYGAYRVISESAATVGGNARTTDATFNSLNSQMSDLMSDMARCQ
jgi:hypothetical protein